MCDEKLLLDYSLTGFKYTKAFANLKIHRVFIGMLIFIYCLFYFLYMCETIFHTFMVAFNL